MRIVFGVYNIGIKEYSPSELGITDEAAKPYTFAVKQRIFHVFWIPIFPLYKIYAMVDRAGTAYHAPAGIESMLRNAGRHKTPWYSFSLLILAVVVFSWIGITDAYERHQNQVAMQETKESFVAYSSQLTKKIQKGDVFVLFDAYDWSYDAEASSGGKKFVLLVDSIAGQKYFMHTAYFEGYDEGTPRTNEEIIQYLAASDSLLGLRTMTKKQLEAFQGTAKDNNDYYISGGANLNGTRYVLHHKLYMNRPNLSMETSSYSANELTLSMRYIGPVARILKFEAIEGISNGATYNKILANESNVQFQTQMNIAGVSGDDDFKFKLTLEDEDGKKYKYMVEKVGYNIHCTLL